MAKATLVYNYDFMAAKRVGKFGFQDQELRQLGLKLGDYNKKLKSNQAEPKLSFTRLPYEIQTIKQVKALAGKLINKFANLVVVGIGGSDLGARAIYQALAGDFSLTKNKKSLKLYFLGDTTDPAPLSDLLKILDLKKTVFCVISKSGDTTEPLANFLYLRQAMIDAVGVKNHHHHFIVITNPEKGILLDIAKKENYAYLPHHQTGGRFSVLSINGLLPTACAGYNPGDLLAGARAIDALAQNDNYLQNSPFLFAALHYLAYTKRSQKISVLMPYNYYVNEFGFWYRQLIAESIGKKKTIKGKLVNIGITPIASSGPTDQHSQIQLYNEGPYDKVITFIKAGTTSDLKVPLYKNSELAYLGGQKFSQILDIEQRTTAVALMKNKRPNATIFLPKIDEFSLGQLFYFFEMATYYMGEMFGIDIFDQPGVEMSKNYMHGLLGKEGYGKYKKEINSL